MESADTAGSLAGSPAGHRLKVELVHAPAGGAVRRGTEWYFKGHCLGRVLASHLLVLHPDRQPALLPLTHQGTTMSFLSVQLYLLVAIRFTRRKNV